MPKTRDPIGVQRRWSLLERDDFTCAYCGSRPGNEHLHIDHIIPYSQGGSDHDNNLVTACDRCNQGKAARVAVPAKMLDGFVGRDGMRTWKRWGEWHLMFDPDAAVLTNSPNGRDYWIPLSRIHEPNWHEHLQWKPWMYDDAELARYEAAKAAHRERQPLFGIDAVDLIAVRGTDLVEELVSAAGIKHEARGERWLDFCDAIDFCRTLVRRKESR